MGETMKALTKLTGLGLFALLTTFAEGKNVVSGTIAKDVDGDTLWVQPSRGDNTFRDVLKVRMIAIDAPESHLPTTGGVVAQVPFGDIAAKELARIAPVGKAANLEDHGLDKYGRTLGRVFINGQDINLAMVEIGWAIPYIICEGPTCDKSFLESENVAGYAQACEDARSEELGIFDAKKPLKEMPFEFRLRMQGRKPDKYVGDFQTKELYRPADYDEVDVCQRIFFTRLMDAKKAGFKPTFRPNSSDR